MDLKEFYRNKKVLITGNTGFKGTWLSFWLESLGATVFGISNDVPTSPAPFDELEGTKRFNTTFLDVCDLAGLKKRVSEIQPDYVFHLAAQSLVRASYSDPVRTWATNVMGTVNVLESIRDTKSIKAAAIISSDKCYENVEWEFAYRENDRLGGKDPYSASKAGTEIAFQSYFQSFFQGSEQTVVSFRAGNVIGGGDWAADRIVPDCVRAYKAGGKAVIRSPGSTRPWQHVLEPLGGYLVGLARATGDSKKWNGQSFNFGPSAENSRTVLDLVKALEHDLPGFQFKVDSPTPPSLHEAKFLRVSAEKALNWMGWKPTLNFEETVLWTAKGYQETSAEAHFSSMIQKFTAKIQAAGWTTWPSVNS